MRPKFLMALAVFGVSLLLIWTPEPANAAIFSCATGEGTTIFQDQPCPLKKEPKREVAKSNHLPLGIHESWFEIPEQAQGRAFCDRRACECGPIERPHIGGLEQTVADALYMDAGWHHYETSYKAWLDTGSNTAKAYERQAEMIEASCSVMISQQLLRKYADDLIVQLKLKVVAAENRGFDIAEPCDQDVDQACDFYASVLLYKRLVADSRALKIPRDTLTSISEP